MIKNVDCHSKCFKIISIICKLIFFVFSRFFFSLA